MNLRLISGIAVLAIAGISSAQFSITDAKSVFAKWDFNTLDPLHADANVGSGGTGLLLNNIDSSLNSTGWHLVGTASTTSFRKADTGSDGTSVRLGKGTGTITGGFYATGLPGTGTEATPNYSLGSVGSGSSGDMYRVLRVKNATGVDLVGNVGFSFVAKTFRRSGSSNPTEGLTFDYGFFAPSAVPTNLATSTGFGKSNLQRALTTGQTDSDFVDTTSNFNMDVVPKGTGNAVVVIDGNSAGLQETIIGRVKNTIWAKDSEFILRWKDTDSAGVDGILSIDDVVVVPEPATMAIFGLGLAGLLGRKRKNS